VVVRIDLYAAVACRVLDARKDDRCRRRGRCVVTRERGEIRGAVRVTIHDEHVVGIEVRMGERERARGAARFWFLRVDEMQCAVRIAESLANLLAAVPGAEDRARDTARNDLIEEEREKRAAAHGRKHLGSITDRSAQPGSQAAHEQCRRQAGEVRRGRMSALASVRHS
jgi:hypothetical protein